jgi:hypothetical protein
MGRCNESKGGIRSVRKACTELGSVTLIIEGIRGGCWDGVGEDREC